MILLVKLIPLVNLLGLLNLKCLVIPLVTFKARVLMLGLSYPAETVLSKNNPRNRILLQF